jgi:hypothetical protein
MCACDFVSVETAFLQRISVHFFISLVRLWIEAVVCARIGRPLCPS